MFHSRPITPVVLELTQSCMALIHSDKGDRPVKGHFHYSLWAFWTYSDVLQPVQFSANLSGVDGGTHFTCLVGCSAFVQAQAWCKAGEMHLLCTPGGIPLVDCWERTDLDGPCQTQGHQQLAVPSLSWCSMLIHGLLQFLLQVHFRFLQHRSTPPLHNQEKCGLAVASWSWVLVLEAQRCLLLASCPSLPWHQSSLFLSWLTLCSLPLVLCWCKRMAMEISTPALTILRLSLWPSRIMIFMIASSSWSYVLWRNSTSISLAPVRVVQLLMTTPELWSYVR